MTDQLPITFSRLLEHMYPHHESQRPNQTQNVVWVQTRRNVEMLLRQHLKSHQITITYSFNRQDNTKCHS